MSNINYNENYIYASISNNKYSQIYFCRDSRVGKELKKFYEEHHNMYEYEDSCIDYLNTKKDIPF